MAGETVDRRKDGYASVMERFPENREALKRLFESNQSFQSLCEEYEECLIALRYWRESILPEAADFRNEFSTLLSELEDEILEHLNKQVSAWRNS
jgi:hypothetical protein